ncbi:putative DNA mismatch repair protein MutS [Paenibacillus agaridevorans]|uniref:Putative DNA mismatch repair protein MutS n=1 Tax=Paenibacillus agaridevorans TaxID=171404 RepID=A0A2R5ENP7_9BACL|nr:putative DNA mismatch repair protein MutS [Paenibacillus agaridevorans]
MLNVLRIISRFIGDSLNFTGLLRFESSFFVGCMNLYKELTKRGCEVAFPLPVQSNERYLSFTSLYNPSLAIRIKQQPHTNDLQMDDKSLLIISGANQGGKTIYLQSIGLAQLMMQCGLFVPATSFRASLCDHIFTHFTREEDETMRSGKLDEELSRLDQLIDHLTSRSLLLMNEPFASTTEREGSVIAKDLLSVCSEMHLRVYIVTHFYELANWAYGKLENAVFVSPVITKGGPPSYKLSSQKPLPTSYGEDLYHKEMKLNNRN